MNRRKAAASPNSTRSGSEWRGRGCGAGGGAAAEGVAEVAAAVLAEAPAAPHRPPGPLLLAVDHCFAIRGQGTVLTGTVLQAGLLPAPIDPIDQMSYITGAR